MPVRANPYVASAQGSYVTSAQYVTSRTVNLEKVKGSGGNKTQRPGGGNGKPLNFHKSSGRPGDSQRTNLKSEVSVCLRRLGVPPRPPKRVSSWSVAESRLYTALARPWCQGTILECLVFAPGAPRSSPFSSFGNTLECLAVSPVMLVSLLM